MRRTYRADTGVENAAVDDVKVKPPSTPNQFLPSELTCTVNLVTRWSFDGPWATAPVTSMTLPRSIWAHSPARLLSGDHHPCPASLERALPVPTGLLLFTDEYERTFSALSFTKVEPAAARNLPAMHWVHLAEPASDEKEPATQPVQVVEPEAENEPAAHLLHEGALEAEYVPAAQVVQLVEAR